MMPMKELESYLTSVAKLHHQEAGESAPTLVVMGHDPDGSEKTTVVVLAGSDLHPYDMIAAVVPKLRELRPYCISLTVDTYMLGVDDPAWEVERQTRYGGSNEAMFKAGHPGVVEALIIMICSPETAHLIGLPYVRTETGLWWQEEHRGGEVDGRMRDVVMEVWQ